MMPNQMIGILGAGQLGKMLGQSAQKMGYKVAMYDTKEACGFGVSHQTMIGDFDDEKKVLDFARSVDSLTYEFENINGQILNRLADEDQFLQGNFLLLKSQHRLIEKEWLNDIGLETVPFKKVSSASDLTTALSELGYPAVLKTCRFGYDGKGQVVIRNEAELNDLQEEIQAIIEQEAILEAFCPFKFEASVIVSRNHAGDIECFPPTENIHREGILAASINSSRLTDELKEKIVQAGTIIAKEANLIGVCGVELFVKENGSLVVNEVAPRPHNTGHYTIEACQLSQFDQHILALTNRPLIKPALLKPAISINILGQHMTMLEELMDTLPEALIHIYDKGEAKDQRKMGHFTILCDSEDELDEYLKSTFIAQWLDLIGEE